MIYSTGTNSYQGIYGSSPLQVGVKYHMVGTYDGTTTRLYLNRIEIATRAVSGSIKEAENSVPMALGCNPGPTTCQGGYFKGKIYNVSFWWSAATIYNVWNDSGKTVTYGNTYGTLSGPVRTGYTFGGWYNSTALSTPVTSDTYVMATADHSIYAKWNPNTYTVNYNANMFSTANSQTVNGVTMTYNASTSELTLNGTLSSNSVTFSNYFKASIASGNSYITTLTYVSGSYTTASSSIKPYFVLDFAKDGSRLTTRAWKDTLFPTSGSSSTTLVANATNVSDGANGFIFMLWHSTASGTTFNNYKVKINITKSYDSKNISYGSNYSLPSETPTRLGYTFEGWYTAETGGTKVTTSTALTTASNHTLYAHWTVKKVTVTFYRNTSTSDTTTATQTFTYGVSGNSFSDKGWNNREGYTLSGWSLTRGGTQNYSLLSGVNDEWINNRAPSVNLYGVWVDNAYAISNPASGADTLADAVSKANNEAVITLKRAITDNSSVSITNKALTIHLNSKVLTRGATITKSGSQSLLIMSGTLKATTTAVNSSSGLLIIDNVTIGVNSGTAVSANGTIYITTSNISAPDDGVACSGGTLNIEQGDSNVISSYGTGGGNNAIQITGNCTATLTDGKYYSNGGNTILLAGTNTKPLYIYSTEGTSMRIKSNLNNGVWLSNDTVTPTIIFGNKSNTYSSSRPLIMGLKVLLLLVIVVFLVLEESQFLVLIQINVMLN